MNVRALTLATLLACVVLVCVTILMLAHVDTAGITSVIAIVVIPIMGAILYGKVERIEQNTNGNTSRLTELLASNMEHLQRQATPPTSETPPTPEVHHGQS